MPYRAKKITVLVTLLAIMAFLTWHGFKKPAAVPQKDHTVRVLESVRSPYFLPQYLALNLGFFKEQNLNVQISTTSPEAIRAALSDGRADIVLCGLQKIIFNPGAHGPQPKLFAVMAGRDGSLLLTRKEQADFQWQKLKDKTIIGNSPDDSSEIALEEVLRRQGLPPYKSVTVYHNIPDTLRLGAFRAGSGNYIQMLEPEATLAESKGYGRVVASVGEAAGDMMVTAYAALPGYIETNPEVIQRFTNAIYKAQLWLSRHDTEEAVAAVMPSFPNLDRQILAKSIERYRALGIWTENPMVCKECYNQFHTAAKNAGEIAGSVTYETTVINDFARQAVETVVYTPEEEKPKERKKSIFNIFKKS